MCNFSVFSALERIIQQNSEYIIYVVYMCTSIALYSKHRTIHDIRKNFLFQLNKIWPCFLFIDLSIDLPDEIVRPDLSLVIDLACRMLNTKFSILIDVVFLIACSNCTVIYARVTYRAELHTYCTGYFRNTSNQGIYTYDVLL